MATVRDLIANSLRTLTVLAAGETPDAGEAEDARVLLNEMIELWNLESLMVYTMPRTILDLASGQGVYTLGTGGDWDIPRPIRIDSAAFLETVSGLEIPMTILTDLEYRSLSLKATENNRQYWIYNDYAFPLSNVTVYPVPSVANQIILYPWLQLTQMPDLDTVIAFPPGYAAALRYNLAIWLAPEYSAAITPVVAGLAADTKRKIKTVNTPVEVAALDPALYGYTRWGYRVRNGGYY